MGTPREDCGIIWQDYFYYCSDSPTKLRWAVTLYNKDGKRNGKAQVGKVAGTVCNSRHQVRLLGEVYKNARVIWEMQSGKRLGRGELVDHIDGDSLNNSFDNLRVVSPLGNARNTGCRFNSKSKVTGVFRKTVQFRHYKVYEYWVAVWTDLNKVNHEKVFSIARLGEQQAFDMACKLRNEMIKELNAQGAGYTERHGT